MKFRLATPVNAAPPWVDRMSEVKRATVDYLSGVFSSGFEPMNNFLPSGMSGRDRWHETFRPWLDSLPRRSAFLASECLLIPRRSSAFGLPHSIIYCAGCCLRSSARAPLKLFTIP